MNKSKIRRSIKIHYDRSYHLSVGLEKDITKIDKSDKIIDVSAKNH